MLAVCLYAGLLVALLLGIEPGTSCHQHFQLRVHLNTHTDTHTPPPVSIRQQSNSLIYMYLMDLRSEVHFRLHAFPGCTEQRDK